MKIINNHLTKYYFKSDKSITIRLIFLASITNTVTTLRNINLSDDIKSAVNAINLLGIKTDYSNYSSTLTIYGKNINELKNPKEPINLNNSATCLRLLCGILCSANIKCELTGDKSLNKRPMNRIIAPLKEIGFDIKSKNNDGCAPIIITPINLNKLNKECLVFNNVVSSAQVKSALLFSGLNIKRKIKVIENFPSRNHTEILLKHFKKNSSYILPGDISNASFVLVKAILKKEKIVLKDVLLNKTRLGFINTILQTGVKLKIKKTRTICGELCGDIKIINIPKFLKPFTVNKKEIPCLIDEIPVLCILASKCNGKSKFFGVKELTYKESNRINAIIENLKKIGVRCYTTMPEISSVLKDDLNLYIEGVAEYNEAKIYSYDDHRIAMSFYIASLLTNKKISIEIDNLDCVNISYPDFLSDIN